MKRKSVTEDNARRIQQMSDALDLIARGVDAICDDGNADMPGHAANGFAEVLRWAAENLDKLKQELFPEGQP